jgi:hypothetical protein
LVYHIQNQLKYQDGLAPADIEVLQKDLNKLLEVPSEAGKETVQAGILKTLRDKAPQAYEFGEACDRRAFNDRNEGLDEGARNGIAIGCDDAGQSRINR